MTFYKPVCWSWEGHGQRQSSDMKLSGIGMDQAARKEFLTGWSIRRQLNK